MSVNQYETRFIALARNALVILPTDRERVRRFIEGLAQPIRLQMARESSTDISFQDAADIARRIEMILSQGGGQGTDKRPVILVDLVEPHLESGILSVGVIHPDLFSRRGPEQCH